MNTIKVWDPFVRVFHWLLVLLVITQLITAESFPMLHFLSGYTIAALLCLRMIWGLFGSKHARFSDFIYPPGAVFAYLKGLVRRQPEDYIGHNPAGGAMVIALLLILCLTALSGLKTLGAMGEGPFAGPVIQWPASASADAEIDNDHDDYHETDSDNHPDDQGEMDDFETWKGMHERLVAILIVLVCFHICGVIVSSYLHKENLVLAMITGKKARK